MTEKNESLDRKVLLAINAKKSSNRDALQNKKPNKTHFARRHSINDKCKKRRNKRGGLNI
jgi:hypothetical protein